MPRATPPNNPSRRYRSPRLLTSIVAVAALACGGLAVGGAASAAPAAVPAAADLKLSAPLRNAKPTKTVSAFVRTTGAGALEVDAAAKGGDLTRSKRPSSAAQSRVATIESTVAKVRAAVRAADPDATELYATEYTVPGIAVVADVSALAEIAKRSDVASIVALTPKKVVEPTVNADDGAAPSGVDPDMVRPGADGVSPKNAASDLYTRAYDAWTATGHTGKGVNIAVLDTGLDYTQADFGGPGTTAAYQDALASTGAPASSWYDPSKFLGGYDFAGPTYNADPSSTAYQPVPAPDANPIDGKGGDHGTHVAGTAAGFGLNADKTTFRGDYTSLTPQQVQDMWVGPGSAPQAGLYSLKVFGDGGGSTDLTGAALDWVGQALTEGKDINVINLSLGSDYGATDDPDNQKIDALTDRGVLPVIASGNADDFTDVGGAPGTAEGALTVAAAATGQSLYDGVQVTQPEDLAKTYRSQYSSSYQGTLPVEGDVFVPTVDVDGCTPFTGDEAAALKGKIAWLKWTDGALECGSAVRFNNVQAAGGIGVLLAGTVNEFDSGIAGNATIPGAELTADSAASLQAAAKAGTLHVRFADELKGFDVAEGQATTNTLAPFTSRGVHGSVDDIVKPDIAGPGVNVISAANGTGNGRVSMSGTSMATPHVAGVAALAFEAHPGWSAPEVKAALMNTATSDVQQSATDDQTATLLRQGTGRVDALQAVQDTTTVRSQENDKLVTASFGVVEVSGPTTAKRTLLVRNTADVAHTYSVAYESRIAKSGVAFSLSAKTVTVPANGTATVTLTMTVTDPTLLRKTIDPTQEQVQQGYPREFVSAATGLVTFTPAASDVTPMRLGVYAAPKPVSAVHGDDVSFTGSSTSSTIALSGAGLSQGSGSAKYTALAAPFVLGGTDPKEAFPAGSAQQSLAAADVRAFGASSTAAGLADKSQGVVSFGVQTQGPDADPGAVTNVEVLIDTNRDGTPDYLTYDAKSSVVDATFVTTVDLNDPKQKTVDTWPLNADESQDTNTFDSAVKVLPVSLSALGYTATSKNTTFDYQVVTESAYAPGAATTGSSVVDETKSVTFDGFAPALSFTRGGVSTPLFADDYAIRVDRAVSTANAKVLLLHLHNAVGDQADVLTANAVQPALALQSGSAVTVTGSSLVGSKLQGKPGTWNTSGVTYSYRWLRDGQSISGATSASYKSTTADVGHKLSLRVTASKTGWTSATATSKATNAIHK